jgi:hypothetical protein
MPYRWIDVLLYLVAFVLLVPLVLRLGAAVGEIVSAALEMR